MTETIYGKFITTNQAQGAVDELSESGINESNISFDASRLTVIVYAQIGAGIEVRSIIERHGGKTQVDDIPDAGTIPEDPLEYSDEPLTF